MTDSGLNTLLKWGVANSGEEAGANSSQSERDPARGLNADALYQLMGGPSDADRMRESMAVIQSDQFDLENKLVAFDNFEQLVEQIDNANNMESLGLWMPLIEQLDNPESDLVRMAAWSIGTAVQNNIRAQERCLTLGAIQKLVKLVFEHKDPATRKKSVRALSSTVRNYQPAADELVRHLPQDYKPASAVDAGDMEAVDAIMAKLRQDFS